MILSELEKGPFWVHTGFKCQVLSPGKAEIKLVIQEKNKNIYNQVHGGVITAIIDAAVGAAVKACLEPGRRAATLELNVHFIGSTREGVLSAKGEIIHQGKTTMVGRCEVRDEKLRLVAYGSAVFMILNEVNKVK